MKNRRLVYDNKTTVDKYKDTKKKRDMQAKVGKKRLLGLKIGRIKWTIAQKAHIQCADILVTENDLKHIQRRHNKELDKLNISAVDYIKLVVDNYDEIREKRDNAIMLVKINDVPPHDTCVLELTFDTKTKVWIIRTAEPREKINKHRLLWAKKRR